ncbi:MAG: phosphonate ABC transporter, permease protein PhnE [Deltaproteobacteria bacterium]|nr:phosphonate ABC transporter, permease protein PhnE [Deltaproteobacteria bacterium]
MAWAASRSELAFGELISGGANIREYLFGSVDHPDAGYFPPDFSRWDVYLSGTLDTLAIALWGTALSLLGALPLGVLGARNGAELFGGPKWLDGTLYHLARRTMDALRAVNELVFALIFVVAVGGGPFAGVLALAVHSAGVLGKLLSEAIEAIDAGQVEAIEATGAGRLQTVAFAVAPQVAPLFVSYLLLRFETNVRAATVVGMTGAGGIGHELWTAIRSFQNQEACAILLIIILLVVAIDRLSASLRARVS